jgi:hypothetical protein
MWNLGKLQVFPVGSSSLRHPRGAHAAGCIKAKRI